MYQTVRGLTIRSVNYKEADQILTVLTENRGCLTVKARGVRRKSSPVKAAAQLFTLSQMTLYEKNGRYTLQEAEIERQFSGLQASLSRLALASYLAEVLSTEGEDAPVSPEVQRLALNCLYGLSQELCPQRQIKAAFELRYMALSGYAPDLTACAVCGSVHPPRPVLLVESGAVRCGDCIFPGGKQMPATAGVLEAARYILSCDLKKLFAFRLPQEEMKKLGDFCEDYLLRCMERGFRTLDFYKEMGDE